MKYNPFRPGKAVTPELFAGREDQLTAVNRALRQTKGGNAQHFVAFGERGIGKSSLLDAAASAAVGGQVEHVDAYDFLVVSVNLGAKDDELDIVMKVLARLEPEIAKRQQIWELLKHTWGLLERLQVAGTGLREKSAAAGAVIDPTGDLARILAEALSTLHDSVDGIVLLLDEVDAAAPSLGRLTKQLVDSLSDERCDRVLLGIAGMPGVVNGLREGHESAPRIFEPLRLSAMTIEDSMQIVKKALADSAERTGHDVSISEDALFAIARYSNGYPQFVQQLAYSAFEQDSDGAISFEDVIESMLAKGGSIEALGTKHFEVSYLDLIKSDEYRAVLLVMASHGDAFVTKNTIRMATKLKETTLTNAVHALKDRGLILAHPAKRGEYRLPSQAFAMYIRLASRGREHLRELADEA